MCATCGCGDNPHPHHDDRSAKLHRLQLERDLLSKNDRYAQANRQWLRQRGVLTVNLMASPGAGKTTLLVKTLETLSGKLPFFVIEGDQQTSLDADRIATTGVPALQINTGKGCHLDAHQISHALESLSPPPGSIGFIENVGNLVCPAAFDLGEALRLVMLSVTEGDDKPLKYPHMFASADLLVISKTDLLHHVDFDIGRCLEFAHRINPNLKPMEISVKTGAGLEEWYQWLLTASQTIQPPSNQARS